VNKLRYISIALLFIWFMPANGHAQESVDFSALRFDGGVIGSDFRLGSNLFGSGVGSGSFGRIQSALQTVDGAVVFGNPASLSHVTRRQIGFETRFPLKNGTFGIGPSSLVGSSPIRGETDDLLERLSWPDNTTPAYTQARSVTFGQPRQLTAFWLTWPVNETVGIGFGYRQPLALSSGVQLSGTNILLEGVQSGAGGPVPIELLANLELKSDLDVRLDEVSIGTGGLLEQYYLGDVWWGISFYRYGASLGWDLDFQPQAMLTISGSERYYFNDPLDPNLEAGESNDFFWKAQSAYKGGGFGVRIGLIHRTYEGRYGSSLLFNLAPKISMWDLKADAQAFLPVFVDMNGAIDNRLPTNDDLIDIDGVDLSKPNRTRKSHDELGKQVILHMPSSLTLGVDVPFGRHNFVFNVVRYWGSVSIEGDYGRESGILQRYNLGKKPTWALRGGLDFARKHRRSGFKAWDVPLRLLTLDFDGLLFDMLGDWAKYSNARYRVSGGLQWGSSLTHGLHYSIADDLDAVLGGRLPTSIAVGRAYSVFERVDVGVHVLGVPDLLMRFSVGLNFE